MNDNCVALRTWAETAETLLSSYSARRSEPKSFDIELEGSPEIFTFPLAFVSTSVYCNVLLYRQALETTT